MRCERFLLPVVMAGFIAAHGMALALDSDPDVTSAADAADSMATEITWDDLVPEGWRPDEILGEYDVGMLSDADPRAAELLERLREAWNEAPVVAELDGATVRLPGFVVPLENDGERVYEFLLVPYYGACIHVPPPPANQTVHVIAEGGTDQIRSLFDTVWVTGTLSTERVSSDLAEAGYVMHASEITRYTE